MKAESEDLLNELIRENAALRKELLWYKRTYDNRSAFRIAISRFFLKFGVVKNKQPADKRIGLQTAELITKAKNKLSADARILTVVFNHDFSDEAIQLKEKLNQFLDTIILDSGSQTPPDGALKFPNIYYAGLLNEAFRLATDNKYDFLFIICSDVTVPDQSLENLKIRLSGIEYKNLGCYGPSSTGSDYTFSKSAGKNQLRDTPFIEGFMFLGKVSLLSKIMPIASDQNRLGWGIDICLGFLCNEYNMDCYIDDSVVVHHREGTGYQRQQAKFEMLNWFSYLNKPGLLEFAYKQMIQPNIFKDPQI